MKQIYRNQRGFAAPFLFVAVIVAFGASLAVENDQGVTLGEAMGIIDSQPQTEFAATEVKK